MCAVNKTSTVLEHGEVKLIFGEAKLMIGEIGFIICEVAGRE